MKLRVLMLLLALANVGFFAWTQGWLDNVVGVRSIGDREPERLARQVHPESLRILSTTASAAVKFGAAAPTAPIVSATAAVEAGETEEDSTVTSAPAATGACLEVGPFTPAEVTVAEKTLQVDIPADTWVRRRIDLSGRWVIYMGKYTDRQVMLKKADALLRSKVPFDLLPETSKLAPGLSLGSFFSRSAADEALTKLAKRGVRTAKVVPLEEPVTVYALRVERADEALAAKLAAMDGDALGDGFVPCDRVIDER